MALLLFAGRTRMRLQILFVVNVELALVAEQPVRGRFNFIQMFSVSVLDKRPASGGLVIAKFAPMILRRLPHGRDQVQAHRGQVGKEERAVRTLDPMLLHLFLVFGVGMLVVLPLDPERNGAEGALGPAVGGGSSVLQRLHADLVAVRMETN